MAAMTQRLRLVSLSVLGLAVVSTSSAGASRSDTADYFAGQSQLAKYKLVLADDFDLPSQRPLWQQTQFAACIAEVRAYSLRAEPGIPAKVLNLGGSAANAYVYVSAPAISGDPAFSVTSPGISTWRHRLDPDDPAANTLPIRVQFQPSGPRLYQATLDLNVTHEAWTDPNDRSSTTETIRVALYADCRPDAAADNAELARQWAADRATLTYVKTTIAAAKRQYNLDVRVSSGDRNQFPCADTRRHYWLDYPTQLLEFRYWDATMGVAAGTPFAGARHHWAHKFVMGDWDRAAQADLPSRRFAIDFRRNGSTGVHLNVYRFFVDLYQRARPSMVPNRPEPKLTHRIDLPVWADCRVDLPAPAISGNGDQILVPQPEQPIYYRAGATRIEMVVELPGDLPASSGELVVELSDGRRVARTPVVVLEPPHPDRMVVEFEIPEPLRSPTSRELTATYFFLPTVEVSLDGTGGLR